jgi:isopentenyldiphosphate isomerase
MDDEMLDVVDGFDRVIGTMNRKDYDEWVQMESGFIRAANMFVMNNEGKLWTPVRTAQKTIAPSGYDFGAAGHVESGEDYLSTIIRETEEEINLRISPDDIEFVAKFKYPNTRYICELFLLRTDETPEFNPNDFVSAEWLTPKELKANIRAVHPTKKDIPSAVDVLQAYLSV